LAAIRDAVAVSGELVNALESGKAAPARAQDIVDRAHALAANKVAIAQTATVEALERTLDTRQDSLIDATGRLPTLQAAPPVGGAAVAVEAAPAVDDWVLEDPADAPGEDIVLSTPEEESSGDLQLREIYSRETEVNIRAVQRFVDSERARGAPHVVTEEA